MAEALALWPVAVDLGYADPPYPVALAIALPLPLLLAPRAPALAGLGLVALALARGMLDVRPPSGSVDTFAIVAGLFVAEASARGRRPLRGAALGALAVGASLVAAELELGFYAFWGAQRTIGLVAAVVGAGGAGYALRDRRAETARLEAELARLRARGCAREAMTEMRRALHLLRGPVPEGDAPSRTTSRPPRRSCARRTRAPWRKACSSAPPRWAPPPPASRSSR